MENSFETMTDEEWTRFAGWLKGSLKSNTVEVTFTKKDGTERVMKCTLDPTKLPKKEIKEGQENKTKKESDTSIAVFDLDKKEWRSFVTRSIKRVSIAIK